MSEFVKPDYAVRITTSESEFLMSPRYDAIHRFRKISWAILRILTNEGMAHIHVSEETAEAVSEATGIPITDYDFMLTTDFEAYLEGQSSNLDDSWLEGEAEG